MAMHPLREEYEDDGRQTFWESLLYPVRALPTRRLKEQVSHKTILITGASFGIGASIAEMLGDFPVTLWLIARTQERLAQLQQNLQHKPCTIHIFALDLQDEEQITNFLANKAGKVDIFINNAGKSIFRGLEGTLGRYQDIRRCAAINYTGAAQLLLGILPDLLEQRGHILNVSSINALAPPTWGWSAYQASKIAFDQWLRCLEPELQARGVAVSTLYLPLVRTRMSMINPQNHRRPAMSKEKAVRLVLRYLVSKRRIYKTWWANGLCWLGAIFGGLWYRIQLFDLKRRKQ